MVASSIFGNKFLQQCCIATSIPSQSSAFRLVLYLWNFGLPANCIAARVVSHPLSVKLLQRRMTALSSETFFFVNREQLVFCSTRWRKCKYMSEEFILYLSKVLTYSVWLLFVSFCFGYLTDLCTRPDTAFQINWFLKHFCFHWFLSQDFLADLEQYGLVYYKQNIVRYQCDIFLGITEYNISLVVSIHDLYRRSFSAAYFSLQQPLSIKLL